MSDIYLYVNRDDPKNHRKVYLQVLNDDGRWWTVRRMYWDTDADGRIVASHFSRIKMKGSAVIDLIDCGRWQLVEDT